MLIEYMRPFLFFVMIVEFDLAFQVGNRQECVCGSATLTACV